MKKQNVPGVILWFNNKTHFACSMFSLKWLMLVETRPRTGCTSYRLRQSFRRRILKCEVIKILLMAIVWPTVLFQLTSGSTQHTETIPWQRCPHIHVPANHPVIALSRHRNKTFKLSYLHSVSLVMKEYSSNNIPIFQTYVCKICNFTIILH